MEKIPQEIFLVRKEVYEMGKETKAGNSRLMLHDWYIEEVISDEEHYRRARGTVTGHRKLADTTTVHTSKIESIRIDRTKGEAVIETYNNVYYCPLAYCDWYMQDQHPEFLPGYEELKESYKDKMADPTIEDDKVLLVLADFRSYYFHSLYYKKSGEDRRLDYICSAHLGMFQDSYLIYSEDEAVDLRYFPHRQNLEFYSEETDGKPFFIENIGYSVLYARTSRGVLKLEPGERKEVKKENAEKERSGT